MSDVQSLTGRKMKNSAGWLGGLLLLMVMVGGCSSDKGLSETEAVRLIFEAKALPKTDNHSRCVRGTGKAHTTYGWIASQDPMYDEINRLIEEGYMEQESKRGSSFTYFKVTEKGEGIFRNGLTHSDRVYTSSDLASRTDGFTDFCVYTHTRTGVDLKELLVNSESGTAVAKYTVLVEPTEYSKKLQSLDPSRMEEFLKRQEPKTRTARFKRWDEGWRIAN